MTRRASPIISGRIVARLRPLLGGVRASRNEKLDNPPLGWWHRRRSLCDQPWVGMPGLGGLMLFLQSS